MIKMKEKTYNIVFSLILTLVTTAIISLILTFFGKDPEEFRVIKWLKTWKLVFMLAYIISLFLPDLIKRLMPLIFQIIENE